MPKNYIFASVHRRNQRKRKKNRKSSRARFDWIHADVTKLTPDQLKEGIAHFRRAISKSTSSLERASYSGMTSPAIQFLNESAWGSPSLQSSPELEFSVAQSYFKHPQHTQKGYKEWVKSTTTVMSNTFRTFGMLSESEQEDRVKAYWRAFNRVKDLYPYIVAEPGRTTNIIDTTKDYLVEGRLDLDLEGMTNYLLDYMQQEEKATTPSIVGESWTFATTGTYESIATVETTYTYTRPDFRTKSNRSPLYSNRRQEDDEE